MNQIHRSSAIALAAVCVALLSACGDKTAPSTTKAGGSAPAAEGKPANSAPPVPVTTATAVKRSMAQSIEATGTVVPVSSVDVKPQITSVITKVHVKEGQAVRAGELLFTLDTRTDEANVAKLKAQITKDEALLADAQRQLARARDLLAKNFVAQGAVDTSQANVDAQLANLSADKAALEAARVPLSYGQIRAASAGRVGTVPVFAGTAVQANVTTMATITQLDPVDVAFSLPQANLPDLLASLQSGKAQVQVRLPDSKKELTGKVHFVDSVVDQATGTVKAKARFGNQDSRLWPGAFVKVSLQTLEIQGAVVVPMVSVIQSARGPIVYVAEGGKAALKPVKVLAAQGEDAAVSGINEGDKVVVNGRQNLRPDAPIAERPPEGAKEKTDKSNKGDKAAS